ncbi:MAG: M48 family metalloprotease [Sphingomonadales bacterium]|jgi:predicted Zn-dependent protease|uniref:M48 family metalloprotease n=1 Tax=Sphingorhabdus sp. TaxID=1902408 RepID=UPI003BAE7934|nr:M48 family metalloprotease [Sphingomonadales bacterium]MBK9431599.1 M48 family metalloprotease [Sphingomonadales bacterium]
MKALLKLLSASLALQVAVATPAAAQASGSAQKYQPINDDERNLWRTMDEYEGNIRHSPLLIADAELNDYVRSVLCRAVGAEKCSAVRIYILRTPQFNAAMAPNGMMVVWSGLLLRTRNEAELATVLAHEFAHFEKRHSLQKFRDVRAKTDAIAWLGFVPGGAFAQIGLFTSVFAFSRDMEREADFQAVQSLVNGGYDPQSASEIWRHFLAERKASAASGKIKFDGDIQTNMFSSHPGISERLEYLSASATRLTRPNLETGRTDYQKAMARWLPLFVDDQIKLNDFGGSEFLIKSLAGTKWSGASYHAMAELFRYRAKDGDYALAAKYYRHAVATDPALAESWRGLGLSLMRTANRPEGIKAIRKYLELRPQASDAALLADMVGSEN